jgi:hypothetical protein
MSLIIHSPAMMAHLISSIPFCSAAQPMATQCLLYDGRRVETSVNRKWPGQEVIVKRCRIKILWKNGSKQFSFKQMEHVL